MREQKVNELIELAFEAYAANESADKYACNAACKAASEAAKRHSEECADAAALLSAHDFLKSSSETVTFAANIADASNVKMAYDRNLKAARVTFSRRRTAITASVVSSFADITHETNHHISTADDQISSIYQRDFSRDTTGNQKAKRASAYIYAHTYATARNAYVIASFKANKLQDPVSREKAFKACLTERLKSDLMYDQIQPSLFLNIMCSTTLAVIAGILILGGAAVILCAFYGVASIPFSISIAAGSASAVVGAGLLAGGFFARKEHQRIEEANERVEETNAIF